MKAKVFLFAAVAALALSSAFGMAKNGKKAQVTGVVEYYGNAPFARLGLKAQDGTIYYLDAKDGDKYQLGDLHGNAVRIDGTLTGDKAPVEMPGAVVLKVDGWKKL
ncbi:MAG: hypothetical protein IK015_11035 [Treponema sp.]|nr:hypothetical protein [Treponema sp.]